MGKEWNIYYTYRAGTKTRPRRWLPKGKCTFFLLTAGSVWRMRSIPRHGIVRTALWLRQPGVYSRAGQPGWEAGVPCMKRVKKAEQAAVKHLAPMESNVFSGHMPLVEHCAMLQYEDGEPRRPGWVTIQTKGAAWQVVIKDPDSACSFTAIGRTLDEALETASLLLACDDAPWEHDTWLAARQKQERKK